LNPTAHADPLVNIQMLGWDLTQLGPAPANANQFLTNVQVNPGDTVIYSILTFLSPTGTINIQQSTSPPFSSVGRTITAAVNFKDGISSLNFDAYQLASDQIQVDFKATIPPAVSSSGDTIAPGQGVSLFSGPGGNPNTKTQNWQGSSLHS